MPTVSVTIKLDQLKVNGLLQSTTDLSTKRAAERVAARAGANVRAAGRVRTGALANSYTATKISGGSADRATYQVGSKLDYATYQEEGIGPVHAAPGRVLRFQPKGSSVFIFRPRTKGFKGAHQLLNAFKALSLSDFLP